MGLAGLIGFGVDRVDGVGRVDGAGGVRGGDLGGDETPAVLPVTGAPWPLRREPGGAWTVTDRQRGLVWRFARRPGYFFAGGQGELPLVAVS